VRNFCSVQGAAPVARNLHRHAIPSDCSLMDLDSVRATLAADRLGLSPRQMQALSSHLFGDPQLFALSGLTIDGTGNYGRAAPTAAALTLLLIGALVGERPSMAWRSAVQLHWHAQAWTQAFNDSPHQGTPPACAITGQRLLGRALTGILGRAALADLVVRIEVSRVAPIWSMWTKRPDKGLQRTTFVACHARELREGLAALPHAASNNLPGGTLRELATLLTRAAKKRGRS
jgi:hypothetical protein